VLLVYAGSFLQHHCEQQVDRSSSGLAEHAHWHKQCVCQLEFCMYAGACSLPWLLLMLQMHAFSMQ
jgi:hypothetical protein